MSTQSTRRLRRSRWRVVVPAAATALTGALIAAGPASAATHGRFGSHRSWFEPGNLVVSGSVYTGQPSLFTPGVTQLPPGCTGTACAAANADGSYPGVFDNDLVDPSFGVTSPIFLDQLTPDGRLVNVLRVPDGTGWGGSAADHVVTSFSSKSEIALNLSTNGRDLTFMGYDAVPDTVDVSNSNTPGVIDPTDPVSSAYYRVVAEVSENGRIHYTRTNAYSGNNGRAAILEQLRRQRRRLHGRERRQRRQPAAGRHHHRRRRADPDRAAGPGAGADAGPADPGRQLQRHPAR